MRLPSECPLALRLLGSRVARMGTRRARPHDVRCVIQRLHVTALAVQSWDAWALTLSRCSYDFNPNVCARLGSRSELQPADALLFPGNPAAVSRPHQRHLFPRPSSCTASTLATLSCS